MRHNKTLLACLATTLLLSCSKKDENKTETPLPTPEPTTSQWVLNGNKIVPNESFAIYGKRGFTFKTNRDGKLYASCSITFTDSLLNAGEYRIGQVSSPTKEAQILAYIEPAGTDSVFHSRDIETAKVKVTMTADKKAIIEIPEIWVKNPHTRDSCKLSGTFIEQ